MSYIYFITSGSKRSFPRPVTLDFSLVSTSNNRSTSNAAKFLLLRDFTYIGVISADDNNSCEHASDAVSSLELVCPLDDGVTGTPVVRLDDGPVVRLVDGVTGTPVVRLDDGVTGTPVVRLDDGVTGTPVVRLDDGVTGTPVVRLDDGVTGTPVVRLDDGVTGTPVVRLVDGVTGTSVVRLDDSVTGTPVVRLDDGVTGTSVDDAVSVSETESLLGLLLLLLPHVCKNGTK